MNWQVIISKLNSLQGSEVNIQILAREIFRDWNFRATIMNAVGNNNSLTFFFFSLFFILTLSFAPFFLCVPRIFPFYFCPSHLAPFSIHNGHSHWNGKTNLHNLLFFPNQFLMIARIKNHITMCHSQSRIAFTQNTLYKRLIFMRKFSGLKELFWTYEGVNGCI